MGVCDDGAGLMRELEGRSEALAGTFKAKALAGTFKAKAQDLANMLCACATMGREPGAGMMRELEGWAEALAGTFNALFGQSSLEGALWTERSFISRCVYARLLSPLPPSRSLACAVSVTLPCAPRVECGITGAHRSAAHTALATHHHGVRAHSSSAAHSRNKKSSAAARAANKNYHATCNAVPGSEAARVEHACATSLSCSSTTDVRAVQRFHQHRAVPDAERLMEHMHSGW